MNNKPITEAVGNKAIVLDHDTFLKMLDRPTLRDQFAMAALTGLMPARDPQGRSAFTELTPEQLASAAYEAADAMLKEREDSDE